MKHHGGGGAGGVFLSIEFDNPMLSYRHTRPDPSIFMYNDVKAAMYKEWKVIKTNKFRKRQHRMLGIDVQKIYNKKVGERAILSRTNIKVVRTRTDVSQYIYIYIYV